MELRDFCSNEIKELEKMIADTEKRLDVLKNAMAAYELTIKFLETDNVEVVQEEKS